MNYPTTPQAAPTCYRHPDRTTYVRCTRCNRPICPECMRDAAVGHQCEECVRDAAKSVRQPRTVFAGARTKTAPVVGDIYIAPDVARAAAAANDITVREELVRLIVHGTLHVLGYDHPESAARERSRMWRTQERLVKRLARRS